MNHYLKPVLSAVVAISAAYNSLGQTPSVSSLPVADYSFSAVPSIISGVDKAVGTKYRFSSVSAGVDAIVTISSAVNASVAAIDRPASLGGGYDAAFQPQVTVNSMKTGYVEFTIDFVTTGTQSALPQTQAAVTALDIDGYNNGGGNHSLYEFDQFDMGAGRNVDYLFSGNDISITNIGTAVRASNIKGQDYTNIDASDKLRFTVYKSNVSSIIIRSGAINGEDAVGSISRQKSFYFARFTYSNSTLPVSDLLGFTGKWANNAIVVSGTLIADHTTSRIEIERSNNNSSFAKAGEVNVEAATEFNFIDKTPRNDNYYRLKMYEPNGKYEYSKILRVTTGASVSSADVYPTVVNNRATLSINATHAYKGSISVMDMNGRMMNRRDISVQKGSTITNVEGIAGLKPGNYIVVIDLETERIAKRIIVANN